VGSRNTSKTFGPCPQTSGSTRHAVSAIFQASPASASHLRPGDEVTLTFASTHLVSRDLRTPAAASVAEAA
jgi:hypothetical protein